MLNVKDLLVRYFDRIVLDLVSFESGRGTVTALLGANGAGKTTLVRAVNGTVPITNGEVTIYGKVVSLLRRL